MDLQIPIEKLEGAVSYDESGDKVTITFVLPKQTVEENPPNYRQWHDARCNVCKHQKEFDDWEVVEWWCDKYAGGGQLGMTCDAFEAE